MRARHVLTAVAMQSCCARGICVRTVITDGALPKCFWTLSIWLCRPGVRRMLAPVGSEAPFDNGRRQIELRPVSK